MNGSLDREVLDRRAGGGELAGVVVALVAQGVVLGSGDAAGASPASSSERAGETRGSAPWSGVLR
ncbi:hypothetical protein ADL30_09835 [Streptomyces sp. NRRL S-1521]|nr:hypothetical protein ADL30_09835 [Streptomyces sp. NRRL S-1521]